MAGEPSSLISTKPSDSNLTVALHPLILLTVSDQITRGRLRELKSPIVGVILGQQKGREITAEFGFPCKVIEDTSGQWLLDQEWMGRRIQQYKDVHKVPPLDVVGWFTLCPQNGPTPELLAIQKQFTSLYNETAILVAVHAEAIASSTPSTSGGKLPLTIYESVVEHEQLPEEGSMQVDGEESQDVRFRALPFSIETDETEMIAINYVAKGAGSAAMVTVEEKPPSPAAAENAEKKGKKRADTAEVDKEKQKETKEAVNPLTTEEEDQIAGITTRLNSVRMLQSRLQLMSKFLHSLPPSYLSDPNSDASPEPTHLPHLRNIQALLTRLSLLTPAATEPTSTDAVDSLIMASQSQGNDVVLSSLLSILSQDVQNLSEMGRKFSTVEHAKAQKGKSKGGYSVGSFGGMEEQDIRPGAAALNSLLV